MSGETETDVSSAHDQDAAVSEWNDLTVAQLKEELHERGLETSGRKADLVARLVISDKELLNKMNEEGHAAGNGETGAGGGTGEVEESDFVVWNDNESAEHDADKLLDGGNAGDDEDDGNTAEAEALLHDEEEEEALADVSREQEGEAAAGEEGKGEDKSVTEVLKAEDFDKNVEYDAKISTSKDVLLMTWRHHRLKVPFRDEVTKEMRHFMKKQNIIMYPVELSDVYSDSFRRHIEIATNVSMELDETIPGSPPKGYLRLKFGSVAEAESAMDEIKEVRKQQEREINMRTFSDTDSEGEVLSLVKKEDASKRDPLVHRMLFVGNLPSEVTEAALKDHFVGVLRVYLSRPAEDSQDHNGYAYLEYRSEAEAMEMVNQYRDTELYGQIIYVIKCLTQRKMSFGLLKDSLRKYWLEQLSNLEATKSKNVTRTPREISELDAKLLRLKRRIDKDNAVRESINLPVPEAERFGTTEADSEADKSKDKEREGSSTRRSSERKSSPPHRRRTPPRPTRGGSSYRGSSYRGGPSRYMSGPRGGGGYSSSSRGGGRETANVLVNQLQELVGVLATRVPEAAAAAAGGAHMRHSSSGGGYSRGPPPPHHDSYGGSYRGPPPPSGGSSRYSSAPKRPHEPDYPQDRRRRLDDGSSYYGGGSSRDSRPSYGVSSGYGGSSRRGGYY